MDTIKGMHRTSTIRYELPTPAAADMACLELARKGFTFPHMTALSEGHASPIMGSTKAGMYQAGTLKRTDNQQYVVEVDALDERNRRIINILESLLSK